VVLRWGGFADLGVAGRCLQHWRRAGWRRM
jgi:hypothetical protein